MHSWFKHALCLQFTFYTQVEIIQNKKLLLYVDFGSLAPTFLIFRPIHIYVRYLLMSV